MSGVGASRARMLTTDTGVTAWHHPRQEETLAMSAWQTYLDTNHARFLDEYLAFLRIPSISSLPEHAADVQHAARWVADRMAAAGLDAIQILPTGGHPVVYGEWLRAPGQPTILLYGHFDVQPVDPLHLWSNPPFEPVVRDGRVYARGASDMKSSLLLMLLAVEALLRTESALPVNVKCLFEGQEEIGSPQLPAFLAAHRDLFACDLVINADGGQWSEEQPAIGVGVKGICGIQIDVRGANTDLHSGGFGGAVANPIHALVQILASLRGPDGAILVDGFYNQVTPISEADRAQMAAVPFDEDYYRQWLGITELIGEPGYTAQEQIWARPTLEINGIWGGFQGEGIKTVLPNEAHAKITCRLVTDQDPAAIRDLLIAHITRQTVRGVRVEARPLAIAARPYLSPVDHWGNQAADAVLSELYGQKPYYTRAGGSVPVLDLFRGILGAHSVSFGFSLKDEQFHAPDEFFRLSSFQRGPTAYATLLHRLAR
jgi:acetylornithine deacetylase/succinyl-diaminopimelate desuccinylase-like protein